MLSPSPVGLTLTFESSCLAADSLEDVTVGLHERERLLARRHLFAEHVERRELPGLVQPLDHPACFGERLPGDVPAREPLDHRPWHGRQHTDDRAVEDGHSSARA